ncbi:MAG: histidine phosphatase family protein [Actinomycetota bacterium]|nr:histidine phosphatase family protein [Actinomycetota bacterium]
MRTKTNWVPAQGEPTVTLLLRHGQTSMSVQKRYAGVSDVPLTDTGVRQAAAAAKRLAAAGLGVIVTSPLQRTTRTAEEVAAVTGVPVVTDEGFRETDFGAWEGLTFAEVRERWPAEVASWLADPAVAPPGGESFAEVSERVNAGLRRVLTEWDRRIVLIVSHVTPIKTLVAAALLAPPPALYRMHLDVAALCEIDWYADGPAVLRSFNDTAHLSN